MKLNINFQFSSEFFSKKKKLFLSFDEIYFVVIITVSYICINSIIMIRPYSIVKFDTICLPAWLLGARLPFQFSRRCQCVGTFAQKMEWKTRK